MESYQMVVGAAREAGSRVALWVALCALAGAAGLLVAPLAVANPWAATGIAGDVNGDTIIDARDVALIRGFIGAPSFPLEADVNGDGIVTMNDARAAVLRCTYPKCAPA